MSTLSHSTSCVPFSKATVFWDNSTQQSLSIVHGMTSTRLIELRVPFGSRNGVLVAPGDVAESGLACGCSCPGCGAPLVLKQRTKRRHFAHHRAQGTAHCVESAIHAAAIQVLLEANWLQVPEKFVSASVRTKSGVNHGKFQTIAQARTIRFDTSRQECTFTEADGTSIRADVVGYRGDKQMIVEMCFTHAVDADKKAFLRQLGLPALEIVLSDLDLDAGFVAVRTRVLEQNCFKEWLFHPGEDEARAALLAEVIREAALMDAEFDAKQARQERQRLARAEQRAAQERQKQAALAQYRAMPVHEIEERLRNQLGIQARWPRHLQVMNEKNAAIAAPPRLWQASLFHRFVFHKPTADYSFSLDQATNWVSERFSVGTDPAFSVIAAVRSFLAYLKGCGFVERHYNPYGFDTYTILHNELMPPRRKEEGQSAPAPTTQPVEPPPRAPRTLVWCDERPGYTAAMEMAKASLGNDVCIDIVTFLYRGPRNVGHPLALVAEFEARGVSPHFVREFLIRAGIAREVS